MINYRVLYGLKLLGVTQRAKLAKILQAMQHKSSEADPYVWLKCLMKSKGSDYYK